MIRTLAIVLFSGIFVGGYVQPSVKAGHLIGFDEVRSRFVKQDNVNSVSVVMAQEQGQQPEGDKHCERPNPDNPEVGGVDPNKIGCSCARKCDNGRPTENYEEGRRCKVHCKPDNCDCPNPCKT